MSAPNAGQSFMQGFQGGRQQRMQEDAFRQQMQLREQETAARQQEMQQKQQQQLLEQNRDKILVGAKIVRQIGVRDQATLDQARAAAAQLQIDVSEIPAVWDETAQQYVQGLVAIADAMEKQPAPTSLERNYQFLQGQDPRLAEQYLRNQAEGSPIVANNGDGTFTIIPRSQVGSPPPPPPGFVLDGGPTDSPSGNFPQ